MPDAYEGLADWYESARPEYAPAAIAWLSSWLGLRPGSTVADVGAGTGKLTRQILSTGADVLAVEPSPDMRRRFREVLSATLVLDGTAESLPFEDRSLDAVVVGRAFHWFDARRALAEFGRVLAPHGGVAILLIYPGPDEPLAARLFEIFQQAQRRSSVKHQRADASGRLPAGAALFAASSRFGDVEERTFESVDSLDREKAVQRFESYAVVAALDEPERAGLLERVRAVMADIESINYRMITHVTVARLL